MHPFFVQADAPENIKNVQRAVSIIPKSVHVEKMEQNIDILDFTLTAEEIKVIAAKDLERSEIVDHSSPDFVKILHTWKV